MNIKQSITSLIILLGVLFSAFSVSAAQPTYKVSDVSAYPDCKLLLGMRVNPASMSLVMKTSLLTTRIFLLSPAI